MSGLALVAGGLLIWSLVLNVVYGNVRYDSLFTLLGVVLVLSAVGLRVCHKRRHGLVQEKLKEEEKARRRRPRTVSLVVACGGCEVEQKEAGKEERDPHGGGCVGRGGGGGTGGGKASACLQRALLSPASHHYHHDTWVLALRVQEAHYTPVLGGETQVRLIVKGQRGGGGEKTVQFIHT